MNPTRVGLKRIQGEFSGVHRVAQNPRNLLERRLFGLERVPATPQMSTVASQSSGALESRKHPKDSSPPRLPPPHPFQKHTHKGFRV